MEKLKDIRGKDTDELKLDVLTLRKEQFQISFRSSTEDLTNPSRKRQIRRMLARVGMPVKALKRIRIGGLALGELGSGRHRRLSKTEVALLSQGARG